MLLLRVAAFEGLLEVLAGFVYGALGVVVGLDGQAVLVDGAVALAGAVEDLADGDVAPDFGPGRLAVAAEGVAVGVDGGLIVALLEENLTDAVAGERALRIGLEGLLVLVERADEVALGDELLAFEDGDADLEVRGGFEDPVGRVDADAARPAEVLTTYWESVPTTSTFWLTVLPSVSICRSTGMLKRSRSWLISPMVRKPLLLPRR